MSKVRTEDDIFKTFDEYERRLDRLENANRQALVGKNVPVGAVLAWTSNTIPEGWLLANGQQGTQEAYPELYDHAVAEVAAGNALWSVNNTNKTFVVPNLQNRVIYGQGTKALGVSGGAETHLLTVAEMPSHNHTGATGSMNRSNPHSHSQGGSANTFMVPSGAVYGLNTASQTANTDINHEHSIPSQGGGGAHNNMPPYLVMAWIIKSKVVPI